MFTGIITHLGSVTNFDSSRIHIVAPADLMPKLTLGMSIAINGVCFTVVENTGKEFVVEYMPETKAKTNLQYIDVGSKTNLELPATPATMLAGHIVQGHVDCIGQIESITPEGNSSILKITIPKEFAKYIVNKGSIAMNGISLTVIEAGKDYFTVGIIPHTWEVTMLHTVKQGDYVNIETDILGKYLERLQEN